MAVAADARRQRPGQQVRALAAVRRLREQARVAVRALHELEAATDVDVWGRYELPAGARVDVEDLASWLALAQAEYGSQPLELLLVAHVGAQAST